MQNTEVLEPLVTEQRSDNEEAQLVARIAGGDRDALGELYERFQRPLFRYLCRVTPDHGLAEEALQDTLVAVWKGAAGFGGRSRVQTWLIGIARRQLYTRLRKRSLSTTGLDDGAELPASGPDPEAHVLALADREELAAALDRLSPAHREVLELNFAQGLSYQEIAEILGTPQGTVKSRLNHAKRALRTQLSTSRELRS
jgi:RNA polymerase sigma-70 factor (ECF subfamily)